MVLRLVYIFVVLFTLGIVGLSGCAQNDDGAADLQGAQPISTDAPVHAIEVGTPEMFGSGCPAEAPNSINLNAEESGHALHLHWLGEAVSLAGSRRGGNEAVSCQVTLPLSVEPGYKIVVKDVAVSGEVELATASTSQATVGVHFDVAHPVQKTNLTHGAARGVMAFNLNDGSADEILASGCAESSALAVRSIVRVLSSSGAAAASLQTADIALDVVPCTP